MALFFWFLFSVVVGVLAESWDRSGILFFVLSLILSPLLGVIGLLMFGKGDKEKGKTNPGAFDPENHEKKCPDCAEWVKLEARICKHCGHEWREQEVKRQIEEKRKAIEEEPKHRYCEYTEIPVPSDEPVCPACGREMGDGAHPKTDDAER